MAKSNDIPVFGPLSGLKVVHNSTSVAGPFAAQLYAEYGADVIWVENPSMPCVSRALDIDKQDRRNQRTIALDIKKKDGMEIFIKLLKEADIFISAAKGKQYDQLGLSKEVLWEHNPGLIIAHISGFGQTGMEEFVTRASYDPIAQAFSGYMAINGNPGMPSCPAFPYTSDFLTALFTVSTTLAAVYNRQRTGRGECVDISQFEVMTRVQAQHPMNYLMKGYQAPKEGSHSTQLAAYGTYQCKDAEVYLLIVGGGVIKRAAEFFGLEYGTDVPAGLSMIPVNSELANKMEKLLVDFCASRSAVEVEAELNNQGIPCTRIMKYEDMAVHPHYIAREVFTEWKDVDGSTLKGVNIIPKFTNTETKIWRGAPTIGMDNDDILSELGYSQEQISGFYDDKVIGKK